MSKMQEDIGIAKKIINIKAPALTESFITLF